MTPRARAHKELTIRNPSRVVKPKSKFERELQYGDVNPKGYQKFEFGVKKKKKKQSQEYLAIINDNTAKTSSTKNIK